MKTLKRLLVALTVGLLAASFGSAQDDAKKGEGRRGKGGQSGESQGRGGQMMNPDARVEQLDRALTLTADQKAKIKDIYTKSQDEMRALMRSAKDSGDQAAAREKMQKLMQSSRDQVRAVLTDEQKTKFDALPQQGRGEGRGRGDAQGRGDGKGRSEGRGKKQP